MSRNTAGKDGKKPPDDSDLERAGFSSGDEWYQAVCRLVQAFARRILRRRQEQEDFEMDAYVRLWETLPRFNPDGDSGEPGKAPALDRDAQREMYRRFAYGVLRHLAGERIRRRRRDFEKGDARSLDDARLLATASTPTGLYDLDDLDWIIENVKTLNDLERDVLRLRGFLGLRWDVIAWILDKPVGTVRAAGHRAQVKIREFFDNRG